MSRLERVYHLHHILSARRTPVSRQQLMEELECSQATLYRLINQLRDELGAPLEQDEESRDYYYDRSLAGNFELPGIWISPGELQALLTAQQVLAQAQPGVIASELQGLQDRILKLLDAQGLDLSTQPQRIHLQHSAGRTVPGRMMRDVLSALFERRRLRIVYHARTSDAVTERDVSPQRLTFYRGAWYLDAWCHSREGLRSFSLERIQQQQPLDDAAHELDGAALQAHYEGAYGIFSGPAVAVAELIFAAEAARWVAEEVWHPQQRGEWQSDGRYRLQVPYSLSRELVMDILRHGSEVEVVAPASLRQEVAAMAAATARLYQAEAAG
ncbi:MAG: YafY family protein [Wenzhouxiangellaceae bacterium]